LPSFANKFRRYYKNVKLAKLAMLASDGCEAEFIGRMPVDRHCLADLGSGARITVHKPCLFVIPVASDLGLLWERLKPDDLQAIAIGKAGLSIMTTNYRIVGVAQNLRRGSHGPAQLMVMCLVIASLMSAVTIAAGPAFPSLERVQQVVDKQFSSLSDYQPGDLISRSQVKPTFDELNRLGWNVRDRADILGMIPGDDEFFVRELRSAAGRKFMRQSGKYPLAYDRIDRMSHMVMGEQNVRALVRGPDGYKMIQYMTSTPYGRNLGQMLSQDPRGTDFNAPMGRIYTADALLAQLTQSYEAEMKARGQNNNASP
jgi:hypothetical protein